MSAFVCDNRTINHLVAGFKTAQERGGWISGFPKPSEKLQDIIGDDPANFGRMLYAMNVNAVEQRYPDCVGNPDNLPGQCDADGHHVPYAYRSIIPGTPTQFYKSLQCYLYQCCEGDVDELPLYRLLVQFKYEMAAHIVENSPSYEQAKWG